LKSYANFGFSWSEDKTGFESSTMPSQACFLRLSPRLVSRAASQKRHFPYIPNRPAPPKSDRFEVDEEADPLFSDKSHWSGKRPKLQRLADRTYTRQKWRSKIQFFRKPDKTHRQYHKNNLWTPNKIPFYLQYLKPLENGRVGFKYVDDDSKRKYDFLDQYYKKPEKEIQTGKFPATK